MNLSHQETRDIEKQTLEGDGEDEQELDETETVHEDDGEPGGEQGETAAGEQVGVRPATPVAAPPGVLSGPAPAKVATWKEDPLNFDESTVVIGVTLHPLRGGSPADRLVTICIHNHNGVPLYRSFRQNELSEQFPLDRLQRGIAQAVQAFRAELSERREARWEEEQRFKQSRRAKVAPRTTTTPTPAATVELTSNHAPGVIRPIGSIDYTCVVTPLTKNAALAQASAGAASTASSRTGATKRKE